MKYKETKEDKKKDRKMGIREGSKEDRVLDAKENLKRAMASHLKPKGKRGLAQVKRLNRTYKTGGFKSIAQKAAKKYGSLSAGKKVAGAIFHKMALAKGKS